MRKSKSRIFVVNGKEYIFDPVNFKIFYRKMLSVKQHPQGGASGTKITEVAFREAMADELGISSDAIKNWIYGYNGPSDIDMIQAAAKCLNIDFMEILVENEGEPDMMVNNQNNKIYEMKVDAVKGLFDMFCEVLADYQEKYGYNNAVCNDIYIDGGEPFVPYFQPMTGIDMLYGYDKVICEIRKLAFFFGRETVACLQGFAEKIFRRCSKDEYGVKETVSFIENEEWKKDMPCEWVNDQEYISFLGEDAKYAHIPELYSSFAEYKANQYFKELCDIFRDIL